MERVCAAGGCDNSFVPFRTSHIYCSGTCGARERDRKRHATPEYREWDRKRRTTPEYRERENARDRKRYASMGGLAYALKLLRLRRSKALRRMSERNSKLQQEG